MSTFLTAAVVGLLAGVVVGVVVAVVTGSAIARRSVRDRDEIVQAALSQAVLLGREQLGAHTAASQADLGAKKEAISASLDEVRREVGGELHRLSVLVKPTGPPERRAVRSGRPLPGRARPGRVVPGRQHAHSAEALANPKARGQWGERMAEDVLRLAGLVENVNYVRQTHIAGRGDAGGAIPDYTFRLPQGHALHMDVKFPLAAYLRHLDAETDVERAAHLREFLRDVRLRVRELAARRYDTDGRSLDYVVLFLPNEHLAGFIHEHDPEIIDVALAQRVVLCSPLTLYAFLGVVRQAADSFVVEQTSEQILTLLAVSTSSGGSSSSRWSR